MKLAVIIFMCIVAVVTVFTIAIVIWELCVYSDERKKQRLQEKRRRIEEIKQRKKREAQEAADRHAREAEMRAMENAARAQEAAARAMNNVASSSPVEGRSVSLGTGSNIQTFGVPSNRRS